jgi:hypothetical protein
MMYRLVAGSPRSNTVSPALAHTRLRPSVMKRRINGERLCTARISSATNEEVSAALSLSSSSAPNMSSWQLSAARTYARHSTQGLSNATRECWGLAEPFTHQVAGFTAYAPKENLNTGLGGCIVTALRTRW